MNLTSLKYFMDIADSGSITTAAKRNFMSQQSMSNQLKKLETYYNTPLFLRTTPMELTPAGKLLYPAAGEILRIHSQMEQDIQGLRFQGSRLCIGLTQNSSPPFLPDLIARFYQACPQHIEVQVIQDCLSQPEQTDLVFSIRSPSAEYTSIPLLHDRLVVAVAESLLDSVYGDRLPELEQAMEEQGQLRLLWELPFSLLQDHTVLYQSLESEIHFLESHGKIFSTNSSSFQLSMLTSGQCAVLTLEDLMLRSRLSDPPIRRFLLKTEGPVLHLHFRKDHPMSPAAQLFTEITQDYFRESPGE